MARQSRWQQFTSNFNSVYGTFNKTFSDMESAKVLKQDFEDEEGNALTGDALNRARTNALADIRVKYGDAEGGLALRSNQAALDTTLFDNELNREIRPELVAQRGGLQTALMGSQINSNNASAANSYASANRTTTLTPYEATNYDLRNTGLGLANDLARDTYDTNVETARETLRGLTQGNDFDERTADDRAGQQSNLNRQGAANATILETQSQEALATVQAQISTTLEELRAAAAEATNRANTAETFAADEEAARNVFQRVLEQEFDSPEAETAWLVEELANDKNISAEGRLRYAETIGAFGVQRIGARAAEITQRNRELAKYGADGIARAYNEDVNDGMSAEVVEDGDTVSFVLTDDATGRSRVVASASGPGAYDIVTQRVVELTEDPMRAMEIAGAALAYEASQAGLTKDEASTGLIEAQRWRTLLEAGGEQARTALVEAQTAKVQQEVERVGSGADAAQRTKDIITQGLTQLANDPMFADMSEEDRKKALEAYRSVFGLAGNDYGGWSFTVVD